MAEEESSTPQQQVRRLYEDAEARTASAMEELVGRPSFGELLARMTENVVALTRMGNDAFDLLVRNLRLAGRQDVTRLARQLARTEDKLELVLQEVERLNERLDGQAQEDGRPASRSSSAAARSSRSSSRRSGSSSRGGSRPQNSGGGSGASGRSAGSGRGADSGRGGSTARS